MTRNEARAAGAKRYLDTKPCKHGHAGERFTSSTDCCVCVFERNKARRKTPEGRADRTRWNRENKKRKIARDPVFAAKERAKSNVRKKLVYKNNSDARENREETRKRRRAHLKAIDYFKSLGIPFRVDHITDETGRKTSQIVPLARS